MKYSRWEDGLDFIHQSADEFLALALHQMSDGCLHLQIQGDFGSHVEVAVGHPCLWDIIYSMESLPEILLFYGY